MTRAQLDQQLVELNARRIRVLEHSEQLAAELADAVVAERATAGTESRQAKAGAQLAALDAEILSAKAKLDELSEAEDRAAVKAAQELCAERAAIYMTLVDRWEKEIVGPAEKIAAEMDKALSPPLPKALYLIHAGSGRAPSCERPFEYQRITLAVACSPRVNVGPTRYSIDRDKALGRLRHVGEALTRPPAKGT
jgi:hypothetical protein